MNKFYQVERYCSCGATWEAKVSQKCAKRLFADWERLHSAAGCVPTDRNGAIAARLKRQGEMLDKLAEYRRCRV